MTETVYLVVENGMDGGYSVERVYLDEAEADAFVEAYNKTRGGWYEVIESAVGAPDVEYDGPVWVATWTVRRKRKGEVQLVLVSENGFTTVVPSAVPAGAYRYREYWGPGWRELAEPVEYEEPAVWIDSFYTWKDWHTGDRPAEAEIVNRTDSSATVRGTSEEAVSALVREIALQVKRERGIA